MSTEKHSGGCHCGRVRYDVTMDLEKPVIGCNCSMCGKKGTLLAFVPTTEFKLVSGEGSLTSYKFNKHIIDHVFCKGCGIKSFAHGKGRDGAKMIALNVRCLDGVELDKLEIKHVDGASA